MKKAEFVKDTVGYMYTVESKNAPKHIWIDEVQVEHYDGDGWGTVWNCPNEISEQVEIKDVYSTYEEAEKAVYKFLLNQLKEKIMESDV